MISRRGPDRWRPDSQKSLMFPQTMLSAVFTRPSAHAPECQTSCQTHPSPDIVSSSKYQLLTVFSPPSMFHPSSSWGEGTFGRPSCDLRALSSGDCSFIRSMDRLFLGLFVESLRKDTNFGCAAAAGPPLEALSESDSRRVGVRGDAGASGGFPSAMVDAGSEERRIPYVSRLVGRKVACNSGGRTVFATPNCPHPRDHASGGCVVD